MSLLEVFPDLTGLSLVLEFMPHTLYSKLRPDAEPLKRSTVRSYTSMLLQGVKYMHSLGIMHRVCYEFDKLQLSVTMLMKNHQAQCTQAMREDSKWSHGYD